MAHIIKEDTVTIPKEEYEALQAFIYHNTIDVLAQIRRIGRQNWKNVEKFGDSRKEEDGEPQIR